MDNKKVIKITADLLEVLDSKEITAMEKIAALKSAASLIEYTIQAESMFHILDATFKKL